MRSQWPMTPMSKNDKVRDNKSHRGGHIAFHEINPKRGDLHLTYTHFCLLNSSCSSCQTQRETTQTQHSSDVEHQTKPEEYSKLACKKSNHLVGNNASICPCTHKLSPLSGGNKHAVSMIVSSLPHLHVVRSHSRKVGYNPSHANNDPFLLPRA